MKQSRLAHGLDLINMKRVGLSTVITMLITLVGFVSLPFSISADTISGFDYTNYYQLEYVQTSDNAYFNTGVTGQLGSYEMDILFPSWGSNIDGNQVRVVGSNFIYPLEYQVSSHVFQFQHSSTVRSTSQTFALNTQYHIVTTIKNGEQSAYVDNTSVYTNTSTVTATATNILIGGSNLGGTEHYTCPVRLYSFSATSSSDVKYINLIPAERKSDNVVGLYDTVNSLFITKTGSGTVTGGNRVNTTQYTITTSVSPSGSGTVSGGGIYDSGASVTLSANPNSGYVFDRWSNGSTTSTITVIASSNMTYTAYFNEDDTPPSPVQYTVTTNVTPSGSGTVTGGGTYDSGNSVTLTATPNNGYQFSSWNDGNTSNPRTITVSGDVTYTAAFTEVTPPSPVQYTVTTSVSPSGSGTVSGGGTYNSGTSVTLTATPSSGYNFTAWSDGNTSNPRTLVLTSDISLTAYFQQSSQPTSSTIVGSNVYVAQIDLEQDIYWTGNVDGVGYMYEFPDNNTQFNYYRIDYSFDFAFNSRYLIQIDTILDDDYIGYILIFDGDTYSNSTTRRIVYVNGNIASFTIVLRSDITSLSFNYDISHLTRKISADTVIIDGTTESNAAVSDFEDQMTDFNDTVSDYQDIESQFNDDFESSLEDLDITNNGLNAMGSNFQNSAIWVRQQFDRMTNNTPFGSVLGFSLVLGVALLIIGRIFK